MKRCLVAAALFALVLSSCDFSFLNQSHDLPSEALHCHVSDLPNNEGKRYIWHDSNETLVYSEDHYIQNELTILIQHFGADGALAWYQAFSYTAEGNLETQREYGASNALQWARKYSYVAPVAEGQILMGARFGSDLSLQAVSFNAYDAGRLTLENFYGEDAASRSLGAVMLSTGGESRSGGARSLAGAPRAAASRAIPAIPEMPVLDMPADEASIPIAQSGRRFWIYDDPVEAVPASSITLDADWYPTALFRHDPARCPDDITVSLSYDSLRRISRKVTQYGSTVALDVSISYDGDTFYPLSVSTSGASLLLPLDYGIEYDTARRPTRLSVSNAGNVLHYFDYAYSGPGIPTNLEAAKSIDPFRFMDDLMAANLVVSHYDGDAVLVETFTALAAPSGNGLEVDVRTPSGDLNGYYLLAKDPDGNVVSLSGHGADGAELWAYSYDYSSTIEELDGLAEFSGQAERLLEYLPQGAVQYASAFVYDLLM